jgi:hypothetical protein
MKIWKWWLLFLICISIPANVHGQGPSETQGTQSEVLFKNIQVTGKSGEYVVTGQAHSQYNHLFYSVEDGHYILVTEQPIKGNAKDPNWSNFTLTISISKNRLPDNGTLVLNLYQKNPNDQTLKHVYPVVLETF